MNTILKKLPALLLLSCYLAIATAFFCHVVVNSKEEQRHVQFGWPAKWVQQDQEQLDPPYPWTLQLGIPQEYPSKMIWSGFLTDTLFFLILLSVLLSIIYVALPNHRAWLSFLKFRYFILLPIILIIGLIVLDKIQSDPRIH